MNIFRHLKLEIALAIPASNEWKIEMNISAGKDWLWVDVLMVNYMYQSV